MTVNHGVPGSSPGEGAKSLHTQCMRGFSLEHSGTIVNVLGTPSYLLADYLILPRSNRSFASNNARCSRSSNSFFDGNSVQYSATIIPSLCISSNLFQIVVPVARQFKIQKMALQIEVFSANSWR